MCKVYLKIILKLCCFGFSGGFFTEQDKRSTHCKETNQVKVLEGKFLKSFFSSFSTKRKLVNDSFELSVSICVLKLCIEHCIERKHNKKSP